MGCQSCKTGTVQAEVTWRVYMGYQSCKTGTVQAEVTWRVYMGYQSCRRGTVLAEVTWRPGKVHCKWGVTHAGQVQFRLK